MLSPQQKATTLVQILFRATHTYSKDSKIRCLVNWSKNRVALVHLHTPIKRQALSNHFLLVTKKAIQSILSLSSWFIIGKRIFFQITRQGLVDSLEFKKKPNTKKPCRPTTNSQKKWGQTTNQLSQIVSFLHAFQHTNRIYLP